MLVTLFIPSCLEAGSMVFFNGGCKRHTEPDGLPGRFGTAELPGPPQLLRMATFAQPRYGDIGAL